MMRSCDYTMKANELLSSVITHDNTSTLLFCDETNDNISSMIPSFHPRTMLLGTLEGLSTINIMNVLNNNQSTKTITCKETVVLLNNCQLDGRENKYITNNLDDFETH